MKLDKLIQEEFFFFFFIYIDNDSNNKDRQPSPYFRKIFLLDDSQK